MTWQNASEADITVQSDADGYNEGVTVGQDDSVHVDTHAEASASASPNVVTITITDHEETNRNNLYDEVVYEMQSDDIDVATNIEFNADATVWVESILREDGSDNVKLEVSYIDQNGNSGVFSDSASLSGNGSSAVLTADLPQGYELDQIYMTGNGRWHSINAEIRIPVSANIDSTSVVTDDIHK